MTPERRIAELLAGEQTCNWHFSSLLHTAYPGVNRRHAVRAVRSQTLHKVGVALIEGHDGGQVAPKPRNATEHRVGDTYIGSVLLHEFDRFDGIDWWEVERLLAPLVRDSNRTPPLQRKATA